MKDREGPPWLSPWLSVSGRLDREEGLGREHDVSLLHSPGHFRLPTRRPRFSERQRVGLVWTVGLVYPGVTPLTTLQALRAQTLTAPDPLTLGVFFQPARVTGGHQEIAG